MLVGCWLLGLGRKLFRRSRLNIGLVQQCCVIGAKIQPGFGRGFFPAARQRVWGDENRRQMPLEKSAVLLCPF